VYWIPVARDGGEWWDLVNTVMNLRVQWGGGSLLAE
jgi:hypothetical protein